VLVVVVINTFEESDISLLIIVVLVSLAGKLEEPMDASLRGVADDEAIPETAALPLAVTG